MTDNAVIAVCRAPPLLVPQEPSASCWRCRNARPLSTFSSSSVRLALVSPAHAGTANNRANRLTAKITLMKRILCQPMTKMKPPPFSRDPESAEGSAENSHDPSPLFRCPGACLCIRCYYSRRRLFKRRSHHPQGSLQALQRQGPHRLACLDQRHRPRGSEEGDRKSTRL